MASNYHRIHSEVSAVYLENFSSLFNIYDKILKYIFFWKIQVPIGVSRLNSWHCRRVWVLNCSEGDSIEIYKKSRSTNLFVFCGKGEKKRGKVKWKSIFSNFKTFASEFFSLRNFQIDKNGRNFGTFFSCKNINMCFKMTSNWFRQLACIVNIFRLRVPFLTLRSYLINTIIRTYRMVSFPRCARRCWQAKWSWAKGRSGR